MFVSVCLCVCPGLVELALDTPRLVTLKREFCPLHLFDDLSAELRLRLLQGAASATAPHTVSSSSAGSPSTEWNRGSDTPVRARDRAALANNSRSGLQHVVRLLECIYASD